MANSAEGTHVKIHPVLFALFLLGSFILHASATTYYVDINSTNPTPPYTNWSIASSDIQSAINLTTNGDLVLVADGTYSTGYTNVENAGNRVYLNQGITVQSMHGPAITVIRGKPTSPAIRSACLMANATLSGFTLTGGTGLSGGGGVYCQSSSSIISNCIITGNSEFPSGGAGGYGGTYYDCTISGNTGGEVGGGVSHATLYNCTITGNTAAGYGSDPGFGGGVAYCTCFNCILNGNTAYIGGGAYVSTLNNCTLVGNTTSWPSTGGAGYSTLNNCIAYYNNPDNVDSSCEANYCCYGPLTCSGVGNITNSPPLFVDQSTGDYHLQYSSPCIDAGNNSYLATTTDLDGNPRISGNSVDMGAYEFQADTITFTKEPFSQTNAGGQSVSFNITAVCQYPMTYQWQFDGTNISGAISTNLLLSNIQSNSAGIYDVVISNGLITATSSPAILTVVYPPPVIVQEPTNLALLWGATAVFSIGTISYFPTSWQWQFDGTNLSDGGQISGSTSSILTVSNIQPANIGAYQVTISNDYGAVTSTIASLLAITNVQIITQPTNEAVLLGNTANLSVSVFGNELSYQWYLNGTPLADSGRITGSTTANLSIANLQNTDGGDYQVIITNPASSAASTVATLTPLASPGPSQRYVNLYNSTPASPYLSWNTAATNIQTAINASVYGDQVIVADGVYQSSGYSSPNGLSSVIINNDITLQSANGSASTRIDGNGTMRSIYMFNGSALIGFTLTNGTTSVGGGIYCQSINTAVSNCLIVNNSADLGGGAYGGTLINCTLVGNIATNYQAQGGGAESCTLNNCFLYNNSAYIGGGAGQCILNNCIVSNNVAILNINQNLSTGFGGGICFCTGQNCFIISNSIASPSPTLGFGGGADYCELTNCVLEGNRAAGGGGAAMNAGTLRVSGLQAGLNHCILTGNWANGPGGGFYGNTLVVQPISLRNCVISNNRAGNGGGVYSAQLYDCLVTGNTATNNGGGCYYYNGTPRIYSSTICQNSATNQGGGIFSVNQGSTVNSIIYNNTLPQFPNAANLLLATNSCLGLDISAPSGFFTNAPLFIDPVAGDFHLQSNSPCINSGNNAFVPTTIDPDGNPRIVGGTVDIGAYEYQTPASIISYAYLQQYSLPVDGSVDFADLDGTGFNVYQDWIAGLNPTNPASVLAITPLASTNNVSGITVTWQSVSNLSYTLYRSTNLSVQPAFTTVQSGITGQSGTTRYTDTSATNNLPYFYRVGTP